ncbi:hypothetical protein C2E23DRAFT_388769 [Lenzites betulinus]|nr:hypothetical protein C2E23DRAFT_388769 [Lenzites betulinus]
MSCATSRQAVSSRCRQAYLVIRLTFAYIAPPVQAANARGLQDQGSSIREPITCFTHALHRGFSCFGEPKSVWVGSSDGSCGRIASGKIGFKFRSYQKVTSLTGRSRLCSSRWRPGPSVTIYLTRLVTVMSMRNGCERLKTDPPAPRAQDVEHVLSVLLVHGLAGTRCSLGDRALPAPYYPRPVCSSALRLPRPRWSSPTIDHARPPPQLAVRRLSRQLYRLQGAQCHLLWPRILSERGCNSIRPVRSAIGTQTLVEHPRARRSCRSAGHLYATLSTAQGQAAACRRRARLLRSEGED